MKMRNNRILLVLTAVLLGSVACQNAPGQSQYFRDWPAGSSPKEVGKRLAENFAKRDFEFTSGKREFVIYPEACAWYGALNVADETRDQDLRNRLTVKFEPFLTSEGAKHISQQAHVDYRVFGIVPLELYLQTKDHKYLDIGQGLAD